ncbi:MAG: signal peptidase II [Acutalibacteraceae bacterium]
MRRVWSMVAIVLATALDQGLKVLAEHTLGGGKVLSLEPIVALRYVRNSGAAFSLFSTHTELLSIGTGILLAAGVAVLMSKKIKSGLLYTAITMVVAGGLGNLIDRVRLGYVIDYIDPLFVKFAVFNFADCLITVGAALLILWLILDTVREKKEKKERT